MSLASASTANPSLTELEDPPMCSTHNCQLINYAAQMEGSAHGHTSRGRPSALHTPGPGQLVVRNAAIGINPFCVGDCVLAMAGLIPSNNTTEGAFQLYTVTREWLTTPQPSHISFEQACALPLALIVAGVGLSRVVITAGGASSVAGTAGLGATDVVDYSSPIMGDKLLAAMRWRQLTGGGEPCEADF
ncbi:hypothetical protein PEX2_083220 [Penicillium expansum]|uniref:Alcohol dehydrogenase superfamily, zinc-type n=1 Tax=Penicillium expansum TaxID=27334 RepID=A0A0A2IM90_PENEN|nr:hypothetical protein PEX2_083220 [Penicillium expansum]KGO43578.1 hypothetical protein PEXP_094800 [Penicillium expansum]KGO52788.1 hypothetical protein PEX2_083220 [Penicillium expansum]